MELLKLTTRLLMIGCLLTVFAGCESKREERREEPMENGGGVTTPGEGQQPADAMGCCQKADNTCAAPVSEQDCIGMGGQFQQGASCGADGMCTQDQMQPQQ